MVGTKYCCWGECKTDSRYTDKWPKSLKELEESASHKLRIDFRCKGSCKGPCTLTAVSDYNARYNVTLYSLFINATKTIDKMAYVSPL